MGQKVNPIIFRAAVEGAKTWSSCWYADKGYAEKLHQDLCIKSYVTKTFVSAGVSESRIERFAKKIKVTVIVAKPGVIIGNKGKDINKLKDFIIQTTSSNDVTVNVEEVKKVDLDARIVALNIAAQLAKRAPVRRVVKKAIEASMRASAAGIKVIVSGRIGGAEIAREQRYSEGTVPLHTLREPIDYAQREAHTTYGIIGVKVWICRKK